MFNIFILSIFSIFIISPFGYLFIKKHSFINFAIQLIYGVIIVSFAALFLNFFFPLNLLINTLILIIPIYLIFKNYSYFMSKKFLLFVVFNGVIIFFLITNSTVYRPDAYLYHLPYIDILNNEKIIFGLANLHFRFGHISIIQYFSAALNNYVLLDKGIIIANAIIPSAAIIYFVSTIYRDYKQENISLRFFYNFFIFIFIIYKMNRYGEYGNDAVSHFLFFIIISEALKFFEKKNVIFERLILISVFVILCKITMAFSIFIPLIFIKELKIRNILNYKVLLSFFLIFFWIIKNLIVSGCIIYPVSTLCFKSFEWVNIEQAKKVSIENEAWTKGWPDYKGKKSISQNDYLENFKWIKTWSNNHLKKVVEILVPYQLFIILISCLIFFMNKNMNMNNQLSQRRRLYLMLFMLLIFNIIWFMKVPVFRYGYSYIVSFIALFFSYLICRKINKTTDTTKKMFKFLFIFFISIFLTKNSLKFSYDDQVWPKMIIQKSESLQTIKLGDFNYKESHAECGFGHSICTHYKDLNLSSGK